MESIVDRLKELLERASAITCPIQNTVGVKKQVFKIFDILWIKISQILDI